MLTSLDLFTMYHQYNKRNYFQGSIVYSLHLFCKQLSLEHNGYLSWDLFLVAFDNLHFNWCAAHFLGILIFNNLLCTNVMLVEHFKSSCNSLYSFFSSYNSLLKNSKHDKRINGVHCHGANVLLQVFTRENYYPLFFFSLSNHTDSYHVNFFLCADRILFFPELNSPLQIFWLSFLKCYKKIFNKEALCKNNCKHFAIYFLKIMNLLHIISYWISCIQDKIRNK